MGFSLFRGADEGIGINSVPPHHNTVDTQALGGERTSSALVFALAFCYTGFGTKMSKPCAQITIAIDEPG